MIKYLIGCDPSFNTFGVAIYNLETLKWSLRTDTFGSIVKFIGANCKLSESIAVVENSGMVSAVFKMWPLVKTVIEKYADENAKHHLRLMQDRRVLPKMKIDEVQSQFSIAMRIAQHLGSQKAACSQIISMFHEKNVPVYEVSPAWRDRADKATKKAGKAKVHLPSLTMPTKLTAEQFKEITGYGKQKGENSNEHSRDAAMLIYGVDPEILYKKIKNIPKTYPSATNSNEMLLFSQKEIDYMNSDETLGDLLNDEDFIVK